MPRKNTVRISNDIIRGLEEALEKAEALETPGPNRCSVDDTTKARVANYVHWNISAPIRSALEKIRGERADYRG